MRTPCLLFAGWEMLIEYSSTREEVLSVINSCGVFDISHMGGLLITLYKLCDGGFLICVNASNRRKIIQWLMDNSGTKIIRGS